MIIDILEQCEKYEKLNKDFKTVFDYIKNNDLKSKECGKHSIKGDDIFVNVQEYETKPEQKLEAHIKYIDIQLVITGEEYMGYCNKNKTQVTEEYNPDKDVMFLNGKVDKVSADENTFVIFYPEDAHMPALSNGVSQKVKKAIFKIKIK